MGFERIAGAFEGDGQNFLIHLRQHFLDAVLVEHQEVFEHEHQMANGGCGARVALLDVRKQSFARTGIEPVEHFSDGTHAAVGFAAEVAKTFQLILDHAGDFSDDFRRDLIETGHAQRHIGAHILRERIEQCGRFRGVEV